MRSNESLTRKVNDTDWNAFAGSLDYVSLSAGAGALREAVLRAEQAIGGEMPPPALPQRAAGRGAVGGADAARGRAGRELAHHHGEALRHRSRERGEARTSSLHEVFSEEQIFRIDHFLGKEPAQNILAFRFANGLFEPIWNRNFIDHVQIDVPETIGLGKRAGFYETTGAYRDMVVTHLFQILAFMAMEPPTALEPRSISEEKNKVFRSMLPIDPATWCAASTPAIASEDGRAARSPTPRPSSR